MGIRVRVPRDHWLKPGADSYSSPKSAVRDWRLAALAGATVGLCLAPAASGAPSLAALAAAPLALAALIALRPRGGRLAPVIWLGLVGLACALGGLLAGAARLGAIDAGALRADPGTPATVTGTVAATPRRYGGDVSVRADTPAGRLLITAPEPVPDLSIGGRVRARGVLSEPEPWRAVELRRRGVAMVLRAEGIEPVPGGRGGIAGRVDRIRRRAEDALDRGMPEDEGALARGFVLGEDDRIDADTREDFRRSGLAHLLAVSGQNVLLLALLAWPLLALLGLTLRARLLAVLFLVAVYVPVTGAGPSIQRAAVMGGAGLVAALADRPRSRWYALLLAAAVTLAANPRAAGDVGWQLSFAAVIGILLWSSRLAAALADRTQRASPRRAVAEGIAVTAAATAATAPLMAHHFDAFSLAALPANLLALPAVAPAMWLGMLSGIAGQLPALPVEPLNWLNSLCLAYIAQVARWLAAPEWALLEVRLASPLAVVGAYLVLVVAMEGLLAYLRRRRGLGIRGGPGPRPRSAARFVRQFFGSAPRARPRPALVALAAAALLLGTLALQRDSQDRVVPDDRLVVRVLDVGQGDSILLDPPGGDPVLVDTGPPGSGVADRLHELGVKSLAAVVITHDATDHTGGLSRVVESMRVARVITGPDGPGDVATAEGARPARLVEGGEIDSGGLHLTALWPPAGLSPQSVGDPNRVSLVLLAEWHHFSMLLTGDAEAEMAPIVLEPVDVLKVAHHGSEDAGLGSFLDRAVPKLAVISVGENSYGHPTPETLAELREHRVTTLRTDESGDVEIEVGARGWRSGS
jgi:competence protein ComEC